MKSNDFCGLLQSDINNKKRCSCSDNFILNKCLESKRFESHICYAGLFDAAMPIIKDDVFAGMVLMGRLRLSGNSEIPLLSADMKEKYDALPEFSDEQIAALGKRAQEIWSKHPSFTEITQQDTVEAKAEIAAQKINELIGIKVF